MQGVVRNEVKVKRVTPVKQEIITRIALKRWERSLKRRDRKHRPDRSHKRNIPGWELIKAPEVISIYEFEDKASNYGQTIDFVEQIRKRYKVKNCLLDFSKTRWISAAALVVVYAAIDEATAGRPGRSDILWSHKADHVNSIIKSSNLFRLVKGHEIKYNLDTARTMPIVSSIGKNQMDEIVDFIQRQIYKQKMTPDTEHVYGDAVSETINNVGLHAYPELPANEKRWWLLCSTFGKELYLAIYDRGIGIPKTVVRRPWFMRSMKSTHPVEYEKLIEAVPDLERHGLTAYIPTFIPDEKLIYLSMQGDVSGTKKDKHGQGSKSIMALVDQTVDGKLWVFSNDGTFNFQKKDESPGIASLPSKFPGTLVQWNIELP